MPVADRCSHQTPIMSCSFFQSKSFYCCYTNKPKDLEEWTTQKNKVL